MDNYSGSVSVSVKMYRFCDDSLHDQLLPGAACETMLSMRFSSLLPLSVLLVSFSLFAQPVEEKFHPDPTGPTAADLPPAQIAGELPGDLVSDSGKQGDWPAIAYTRDGSLWAIWIEWNDRDADRILLRRRDPQGKWGPEIPIADGNWDHYSPTLAALPDGVMALWSGQSNGNYDLFASTVSGSGKPSLLAPPHDRSIFRLQRASRFRRGGERHRCLAIVPFGQRRYLRAALRQEIVGTGDAHLLFNRRRLGACRRSRPRWTSLDLMGRLRNRQLRCISALV